MTRSGTFVAGAVAVTGALALPASLAAHPQRAPSPARLTLPALRAGKLARCYQATGSAGVTVSVALSGGGAGHSYEFSATVPRMGQGSAGVVFGTFNHRGDATATIRDLAVPEESHPRGELFSNSDAPSTGRPIAFSVSTFDLSGPHPTRPDRRDTISLGTVLLGYRGVSVGYGNIFFGEDAYVHARHRLMVADAPFAGKTLYGFFTNRAGTRVLNRFVVGKADSPCGYATRVVSVAPPELPAGERTYRIWVNPGTRLDPQRAVSEPLSVTGTGSQATYDPNIRPAGG
jgi:hypothetical protein